MQRVVVRSIGDVLQQAQLPTGCSRHEFISACKDVFQVDEFFCFVCAEPSPSYNDILRHIAKYDHQMKFCRKCDKIFTAEHMKKHGCKKYRQGSPVELDNRSRKDGNQHMQDDDYLGLSEGEVEPEKLHREHQKRSLSRSRLPSHSNSCFRPLSPSPLSKKRRGRLCDSSISLEDQLPHNRKPARLEQQSKHNRDQGYQSWHQKTARQTLEKRMMHQSPEQHRRSSFLSNRKAWRSSIDGRDEHRSPERFSQSLFRTAYTRSPIRTAFHGVKAVKTNERIPVCGIARQSISPQLPSSSSARQSSETRSPAPRCSSDSRSSSSPRNEPRRFVEHVPTACSSSIGDRRLHVATPQPLVSSTSQDEEANNPVLGDGDTCYNRTKLTDGVFVRIGEILRNNSGVIDDVLGLERPNGEAAIAKASNRVIPHLNSSTSTSTFFAYPESLETPISGAFTSGSTIKSEAMSPSSSTFIASTVPLVASVFQPDPGLEGGFPCVTSTLHVTTKTSSATNFQTDSATARLPSIIRTADTRTFPEHTTPRRASTSYASIKHSVRPTGPKSTADILALAPEPVPAPVLLPAVPSTGTVQGKTEFFSTNWNGVPSIPLGNSSEDIPLSFKNHEDFVLLSAVINEGLDPRRMNLTFRNIKIEQSLNDLREKLEVILPKVPMDLPLPRFAFSKLIKKEMTDDDVTVVSESFAEEKCHKISGTLVLPHIVRKCLVCKATLTQVNVIGNSYVADCICGVIIQMQNAV